MRAAIYLKTINIITKVKTKPITMKNFKIIHIAILLIYGLYGHQSVQAQGNDETSLIIGQWRFMEGPSFANISPENKEVLDSDPILKTKVMSGYKDRILLFHPDGKFNQMSTTGRNVEGTWQLNGSELIITALSGNQWIQQVVGLDKNRITLQQIASGEGEPMFSEIYFLRIK